MNSYARIRPAATAALLAVAGLLSVSWLSSASGAEPKFVGMLTTIMEDAVAKELQLTEEQKGQLQALIDSREDSQELTELILTLRDLDPAEGQQKLAGYRQKSETQGLALLTPQQREKLRRINVRRAGLASLANPQTAEDFALSDQQRAQVGLVLKLRGELLEGADQERARLIQAETDRKLRDVLTDQQRAAWDALTAATGQSSAAAPAKSEATPSPDAAEAEATSPADATEAEDEPMSPPDPANVFGGEPPQGTEPPAGDLSEEAAPVEAAPPAEDLSEEAPPKEAAPPAKPAKLRFNFKGQQWSEVLEWFAKNADLSYMQDLVPPGTFSYVDQRDYTPAEAIDVLNSVLLTKGYTLIRRDRMLMLISTEEEIPGGLVPVIPAEKLDDAGEFELVSVLFKLDKLTPDEARQEIEGIVGRQGKIVALPKSQQIQVTETGGRLRAIREVFRRIDGPEAVVGDRLQTYPLKFATPNEALAVMRPLLDIPADAFAPSDGSIRLAIDEVGNRLLATGKPEKLDRVKEILSAIDVSDTAEAEGGTAEEPLQLVVYPIVDADPDSVLAVLQTLLAGEPDVRLAIDPKSGSLVALARPSQHETYIRPTLEQYEGSTRLVEVIHLQVVDPSLAVLSINKLFDAGGEKPNPNAPLVDADPTSRQLLVRGTASQIAQIRTLMEKMGEDDTTQAAVAGGQNVRMVQLNSRAARAALEQLQEFWPAMRRNKIRVVTPSALVPSMRDGAPSEIPPTPQNPAPQNPAPQATPSLPVPGPTPVPKEPARQPAAETVPAPNRAAGLAGGARVIFAAAETVEVDPQPAEPAAEPAAPVAQPVAPVTPPAAPATPPDAATPSPSDEAPPAEPAPPSAEPPAPETPVEPPPIVVTFTPGGVMIASQDTKALDDFETWLTNLAGGTMSEVSYPTIFYLKHAKVAVVAETLDQIFGGGTLVESAGGSLVGDVAQAALGGTAGGIIGAMLGGGGGTITPSGTVRITPETRLNALIVQAGPSDVEIIEELLKILDQPESPEDVLVVPKSKIIPIFNTQADRIAEIVKEVFKNNLATTAGASGGGSRPSPEQLMQMLRGGRGGSSSRGGTRRPAEEVQKMTLGVDMETNALVVAAPEPLLTQVESLVRDLDQMNVEANNQAMRTVILHKSSPEVVGGMLRSVFPSVQIGTTGSSSSKSRTSSPSRTSSSTSSTQASDAARRAYFFEMMRRRMSSGGGPPGGGSPPGGGRPSGGGPPSRGRPGGGGPPSGVRPSPGR